MGMGTYEQVNKWIDKDLWYNPLYTQSLVLEITPPTPHENRETISLSDDSETPPPSTSCSSSTKPDYHGEDSPVNHGTPRRGGCLQHCRQCAAQGLAKLSAMSARDEPLEQQTLNQQPPGSNPGKTIARQGRICYRNWDYRQHVRNVMAKSLEK